MENQCLAKVCIVILALLCTCLVIVIILHKTQKRDFNGKKDELGDHFTGTNGTSSTTAPTTPEPRVPFEFYGFIEGTGNVTRYTLQNGNMTVKILDFGGIITNIMMPDRNGKIDDIVLGCGDLKEYAWRNVFLGAIVGRYANVIKDSVFRLDGVKYALHVDDGIGQSSRGFSKRLWNSHAEANALVLTYSSPDGEDGFPGNVNVTVTYELTERNELIISYKATTSRATVINLTNRSFFNLAGHASGNVDDHMVRIVTHHYTPVDDNHIPTGTIDQIEGTMYDVRATTPLGPRLPKVPGDRGFDTNFAFGRTDWDKHMARVSHPASGRTLDIYSTEPGLQFNTGYHLQGIMGKDGVVYRQYGGLSLEAQHYPNSPNEPRFPTTILRPEKPYIQTTKYVFGVEH